MANSLQKSGELYGAVYIITISVVYNKYRGMDEKRRTKENEKGNGRDC